MFAFNLRYGLICILIVFICFGNSQKITASNEISNTLSELPFFHEFTQEELQMLTSIANIREAEKGEKLFFQGIISDKMYVLIEGSASVYSGGQFIVELNSPQIFGELELIDRRGASADVIISKDSRIIEFLYDDILEVLNTNNELGYKFLKQIVDILSVRLLDMNPE